MTGNVLWQLRMARGHARPAVARKCGWTVNKVVNMEAHGKSYTTGLHDRNATRARDWGRFLNALRALDKQEEDNERKRRFKLVART